MAQAVSRRAALGTLGLLGAAAATGALTLGAPRRAEAQQLGLQELAQDALKRLFGSRPIKDGSGVVKLDIPLIAENGAVVPVTVEAQSPMTPQNHVRYRGWTPADFGAFRTYASPSSPSTSMALA